MVAQNYRQAVVVIHGIGEQQPMATLRSFLRGIGIDRFFNKPNSFSDNFELRRFAAPGARYRPRTDFFELYWAHHLEKERLRDSFRWGLRLVGRKPFWRHNSQLKLPMALFQLILLPLLLIFVTGGLWLMSQVPGFVRSDRWGTANEITDAIPDWWELLFYWGLIALGGVIIIGFITRGIRRFFTHHLSDALRYLSPEPEYITARNQIRAEGVKLLRDLHESGNYNRIIVVGHSLGSVIGLDILRISWNRFCTPDLAYPQQAALAKKADKFIEELDRQRHTAGADPAEITGQWQDFQFYLWTECRKRGVPWLVTDFITLGSPLAHASFLLDRKNLTFGIRKQEGEYPVNPPTGEESLFYSRPIRPEAGKRFNIWTPHSGALFAVTRWSNAYFPVAWCFGDPIGGDLGEEFGWGIRNIRIRARAHRRWTPGDLLLACHSGYWKREPDRIAQPGTPEDVDGTTGTRVCHAALEELLQLDTRRLSETLPPPTLPKP